MSPQDILLRNYLSVVTSLSHEEVEDFFKLPSPPIFDHILDGPFGKVELGCDCQAIQGYRSALHHVIELVKALPVAKSGTSEKDAVLQDRDRLVSEIKGLEDQFEEEVIGEPENDDDPLLRLIFEALFGVKFRPADD